MKPLLALQKGFNSLSAIQSRNLHTSLRHALRALQPAREELHDGHHLVAVARHTISRFAITLDLHELEQTLELVFCSRGDDRAVLAGTYEHRSLALGNQAGWCFAGECATDADDTAELTCGGVSGGGLDCDYKCMS